MPAFISFVDRIEELEEELGCTKTERHADAEYIGHLMAQLRSARREALEEAARVAERVLLVGDARGTAFAIATAIRALMEAKDE